MDGFGGMDGLEGSDGSGGPETDSGLGAPAANGEGEQTPTAPRLRAVLPSTPLTASRAAHRRMRLAWLALTALLVIATVAGGAAVGGWALSSPSGLLANAPFLSNLGLSAPPTAQNPVGVGAAQQPDPTSVISRGQTLPTPPATPATRHSITGSGGGGGGGGGIYGFPTYTGPISSAVTCPNGSPPAAPGNGVYGGGGNQVALTFDDGPTPYYSPAIISYLESTHTPATFFVLGQYAQAYPYLVQREAAGGFAIGIHSWSHPDMRQLSPAQQAWQLEATAQQIRADIGDYCLWLWRPPYGSYDASITNLAGKFGLTTIVWDDDPADWSQPGTQTIVDRVLAEVHPGSIILMHDGPGGRSETLAALPQILAGLQAKGLTPVTLPQLLGGPNGAARVAPRVAIHRASLVGASVAPYGTLGAAGLAMARWVTPPRRRVG